MRIKEVTQISSASANSTSWLGSPRLAIGSDIAHRRGVMALIQAAPTIDDLVRYCIAILARPPVRLTSTPPR
jgi:hypothetical protein